MVMNGISIGVLCTICGPIDKYGCEISIGIKIIPKHVLGHDLLIMEGYFVYAIQLGGCPGKLEQGVQVHTILTPVSCR